MLGLGLLITLSETGQGSFPAVDLMRAYSTRVEADGGTVEGVFCAISKLAKL